MTERTIRNYAKELAGKFYDQVRSAEKAGEKVHVRNSEGRAVMQIDPRAFGKTYPTVEDYLRGRKHGALKKHRDGSIEWIDTGAMRLDTPGWMHWYAMAREQLTSMLGRNDVHENIKQGIYRAVIEDREKQLKYGTAMSPAIVQRKRLIQ